MFNNTPNLVLSLTGGTVASHPLVPSGSTVNFYSEGGKKEKNSCCWGKKTSKVSFK